MSKVKKQPIEGSERNPLPGARIVGAVDPNERILVTVLVRRKSASKGLGPLIADLGEKAPHERQQLIREKFAMAHGASPADLEKIEEFAHVGGETRDSANTVRHLYCVTLSRIGGDT